MGGPVANLSWGVSLMDPRNQEDLHSSLQYLKDDGVTSESNTYDNLVAKLHDPEFLKIFGLGPEPKILKNLDEWKVWKNAYEARIPVDIVNFGYYDFPYFVVVIDRTYNLASDYEVKEIHLADLEIPASEECVALTKVLDFLRFGGDRTIKLLLSASDS